MQQELPWRLLDKMTLFIDNIGNDNRPKDAHQDWWAAANAQKGWDAGPRPNVQSRQAPNQPRHDALPEPHEDFSDLPALLPLGRGVYGVSQARPSEQGPGTVSQHGHGEARTYAASQNQLEASKKELQGELDQQLKKLESERKEGLYRLDWELAEAVEALHAKHADRANMVIRKHKEFISQMEKRAQAGEELTPDTVQRMRTPAQAPMPPQQYQQQDQQQYQQQVFEQEVSESEEESEDENDGLFNRFMRGRLMTTLRGGNNQFQSPMPTGRDYRQESFIVERHAGSPEYFHNGALPPFIPDGGMAAPAMPGVMSLSSPMAMISTFESPSLGSEWSPGGGGYHQHDLPAVFLEA